MQLLHTPDEENIPQVIHIVYRETLPRVHARARTIPLDPCSVEQGMDAHRCATLTSTNPLVYPESTAISSRSDVIVPEVALSPGDQNVNNPLVPELAAQTVPRSIFFHAEEAVEVSEDLRYDAATPSVHETFPLPTCAAYPEYIHETLAYTSSLPPARNNYYRLWNHVLEYWFPPTEGFQIVEDWDAQLSLQIQHHIPRQSSGQVSRPKPSLAILDVNSPTEPFLFVTIHNGMPVNDLSRTYARTTLEEAFETLRACSFCAEFKTLCVISAVGARWNMVVRETGWLEGEMDNCTDYVGQWEDDVTTSDSYGVMGYCFKELKRSVLRRSERRNPWPT